MKKKNIYTTAVHAGSDPNSQMGSLSPPIYQTSIFTFPDAEQGSAIHENEQDGYFYGRIGNPTQRALEDALRDLEGGEDALALSSGMGAISVAVISLVQSGDHIVVPDLIYPSTEALFRELLESMNIEISYIDSTKATNYEAAMRPNTKLFYVETPSNPTLNLVDLKAVAEIAKKNNIITICDNTFATPINQRPIELGIDVVIHSATKYLGGHSDLVAGAIVGSREFVEKARWKTNKMLGSVISPHTAWLVLRGMRTLALRMERHNSNACEVAQFLEAHSKIERVHYPGLPSHPQVELADQQMDGYGGMIAFEVAGLDEGRRLVDNVELISLAVSLGDVASLIQHSASMTSASVPREARLARGITDGLLRFSVGIEDVEDIKEDLQEALSHV
jgi:methionine-gamma-lyase